MMALAAQTSILSTMIVALVIIAIVAWIIRGMIQKKRSGTFIGCDCGCANCPHSCHNPKNSNSQSGCGGCGGC